MSRSSASLPYPATAQDTHEDLSRKTRWKRKLRNGDARTVALLLVGCLVLGYWFRNELGTARRDLGYLLRPVWDRHGGAEMEFHVVPHYGRDLGSWALGRSGREEERRRAEFCAMFGWEARPTDGKGVVSGKPVIVDAVLVSTELDMLEIRMREYEPFVDLFIVVESNMTFAGTPKRKYFAEQWNAKDNRFDFIPRDKIVYLAVDDLTPNLPPGSFENESAMRSRITQLLHEQASLGRIPSGSLILHSDVDEIVSRDTLTLLSTCQGFPSPLHLQVRNYRYGFTYPLLDQGYWRPKVVTHNPDSSADTLQYGHGRAGDTMLADAGWHCSWCFETLEEMKIKMLGYSHNDRVRGRKDLLDTKKLSERVCKGEEPFGMLPVCPSPCLNMEVKLIRICHQEAYTFRDLIKQTGPLTPSRTFRDVPVALKQDPERFAYLMGDGCSRQE
jgi:beta-1,4-mannosyl-glycoprotein beta-1,4-N-acetylglucosaminyltransferase